MDVTAVLVVMAAIFVWGAFSARLQRADLTAPIVFVALGGLLAAGGLVDQHSAPERFRPLVELTLVWVLFSDAARVPFREFRRDLAAYARLLGVGLPLERAGRLGAGGLAPARARHLAGPAGRGGPGAHGRGAGHLRW